MAVPPLFSIIVVDYEGSVSRRQFRELMICLKNQTNKNFEVLVFHDGPKETSYEEDVKGLPIHKDTHFFITDKRKNDWGHSNRNAGINLAQGEWIIHTNADNKFYDNLISTLAEHAENETRNIKEIRSFWFEIRRKILKFIDKRIGSNLTMPRRTILCEDKDILVYAIRMRGHAPVGTKYIREPAQSHEQSIILGGVPVKYGNIDAMQFVMRRSIWLAEGGWYDTGKNSDGKLYQKFAKKYCIHAVPEILGEHW